MKKRSTIMMMCLVMLFCAAELSVAGSKGNILFITQKDWREYAGTSPETGVYADSFFVADLRNAGYDVSVPDYADFQTVGPEQVAALNMADLVILGRGANSGDFDDSDDHVWKELRKPIMVMTTYIARAKRQGWLRTNDIINMSRLDTFYAKIEMPDDPIFAGLEVPEDMVIPYAKDMLGITIAHKDSVGINGDVVMSLAGIGTSVVVDMNTGEAIDTVDMADYAGHILLARWAPGDSMYSGLVGGTNPAAVPGGYRSYVLPGHNDEWTDEPSGMIRNYYSLTDIMNQVWLNEVERLISLPVPEEKVKKKILFITQKDWRQYAGTSPETGVYADSFFVADLRNAGYDVSVPDYADYTTVGREQIENLINVDLVILGRGANSGDFDDSDDFIWKELGTPIMVMTTYIARAKRQGWLRTNDIINMSRLDTFYAKIEMPDDPIFASLEVPEDMVIPYAKDMLGITIAHKDSVGINGDVVMSLAGIGTSVVVDMNTGEAIDTVDVADYAGHILLARWAPGDSMYSGLVGGTNPAAVPGGYRSYVLPGHNDEWTDEPSGMIRNYYSLTDIMNQVWLNEVARMVHLWMPSDHVTSISTSEHTPSQYVLKQNYPNPFNPMTTIEFSLAKASPTTIKVYNVMGQNVATLLDENMATGNHRITVRLDDFSSGVYFYKIKSGDFSKVKKMMLVK